MLLQAALARASDMPESRRLLNSSSVSRMMPAMRVEERVRGWWLRVRNSLLTLRITSRVTVGSS
jgi:hypothetical protein